MRFCFQRRAYKPNLIQRCLETVVHRASTIKNETHILSSRIWYIGFHLGEKAASSFSNEPKALGDLLMSKTLPKAVFVVFCSIVQWNRGARERGVGSRPPSLVCGQIAFFEFGRFASTIACLHRGSSLEKRPLANRPDRCAWAIFHGALCNGTTKPKSTQ